MVLVTTQCVVGVYRQILFLLGRTRMLLSWDLHRPERYCVLLLKETKASGQEPNPQMLDFLEQSTAMKLEQQSTALFNTAMLHDDGIIDPRDTRKLLIFLLETIYEAQQRELNPTRFGVSRFNQSLP